MPVNVIASNWRIFWPAVGVVIAADDPPSKLSRSLGATVVNGVDEKPSDALALITQPCSPCVTVAVATPFTTGTRTPRITGGASGFWGQARRSVTVRFVLSLSLTGTWTTCSVVDFGFAPGVQPVAVVVPTSSLSRKTAESKKWSL